MDFHQYFFRNIGGLLYKFCLGKNVLRSFVAVYFCYTAMCVCVLLEYNELILSDTACLNSIPY